MIQKTSKNSVTKLEEFLDKNKHVKEEEEVESTSSPPFNTLEERWGLLWDNEMIKDPTKNC